MKITTLLENNTTNKKLKSKHGLSLYLELNNSLKILFDVGPDNTYLHNAKKLGISIADVDYLIISHGHHDHGGGLKSFLKANTKAKVLISKYAFDKYYSKVFNFFHMYVGLDPRLKSSGRIQFVEGQFKINDNIYLFDGVIPKVLFPNNNAMLFKKSEGSLIKDSFDHEINLVITEQDKVSLFTGCSHKGIINIINHTTQIMGTYPNYVIGGMHLYNPINKKTESEAYLNDLSIHLHNFEVEKYYTFHCTGEKAYNHLKNTLGLRITNLNTGDQVDI